MTPEQQQQFNQELQMVIAVAAQLCPPAGSTYGAVSIAMELIREAETELKELYDKQTPTPKTSPEPPVPAPFQPRPSRKVIEESISAASQVLLAKKLKTQDELVAMLQAYGVKSKSQLTDEQAVELMEKLKSLTKEK